MTPKEIIEHAVSILQAQLTATSHIPRFTDINKIRQCHLSELSGALQVLGVPDVPEIWSQRFGYQLPLAKVIIAEHRRTTQQSHPVTPPRPSSLPLRV